MFRFEMSPAIVEIPDSVLTAITRTVTAPVDGAASIDAAAPLDGVPSFDEPAPAVGARRLYQLQADTAIDVEFRPKWRATAEFRRTLEYLPILPEPLFSNGGRLTVTGVIGRRFGLSAVAGYANGESAVYRGANRVDTYTGDARVRYVMTRSFALYSQYTYYYYDLRGQAHLAPDLPPIFKQQGIRVGFLLFGQPIGRQGESRRIRRS